jgi:hypothetical protein
MFSAKVVYAKLCKLNKKWEEKFQQKQIILIWEREDRRKLRIIMDTMNEDTTVGKAAEGTNSIEQLL